MSVFHPTTALPAPPLQVAHWLNTPRPIALGDLRGRVVGLHAFQMLCPGCVAHGLPQAARLHELFPAEQLAVIGLHTVFEHHDVMQPLAALQAFVHEYRLAFPIGIDRPDPQGGPVPLTMQALGLRGTPSLLLLDKRGRVRFHQFGRADDLRVGALIGQLMVEPDVVEDTVRGRGTSAVKGVNDASGADGAGGTSARDADGTSACDADGCRLPEARAEYAA